MAVCLSYIFRFAIFLVLNIILRVGHLPYNTVKFPEGRVKILFSQLYGIQHWTLSTQITQEKLVKKCLGLHSVKRTPLFKKGGEGGNEGRREREKGKMEGGWVRKRKGREVASKGWRRSKGRGKGKETERGRKKKRRFFKTYQPCYRKLGDISWVSVSITITQIYLKLNQHFSSGIRTVVFMLFFLPSLSFLLLPLGSHQRFQKDNTIQSKYFLFHKLKFFFLIDFFFQHFTKKMRETQ